MSPSQCASAGLQANPEFLSGLVSYDLTRGGRLYRFAGHTKINQLACFGQDSITLGHLTLSLGLRFDDYHGLTDGGVSRSWTACLRRSPPSIFTVFESTRP